MPKHQEQKLLPHTHLWVLLTIKDHQPATASELLSYLEAEGLKKSLEHLCSIIRRLRNSGMIHANELRINKLGEKAIEYNIEYYQSAVAKHEKIG